MEKLFTLFGLQHALNWLTLHMESDLHSFSNCIYLDINVIKVSLLIHTHTYSETQANPKLYFVYGWSRAGCRTQALSLALLAKSCWLPEKKAISNPRNATWPTFFLPRHIACDSWFSTTDDPNIRCLTSKLKDCSVAITNNQLWHYLHSCHKTNTRRVETKEWRSRNSDIYKTSLYLHDTGLFSTYMFRTNCSNALDTQSSKCLNDEIMKQETWPCTDHVLV